MKCLSLLIILVLLTGCASTTSFTSLPKTDNEFLLDKAKLSANYPEISTYEKHWRGFSKEYPTEQSLISELGEPHETKRYWLYPIVVVAVAVAIHAQPIVWGIVIAIRPDIPETYYFKKGNYCVEARMDRTIFDSYRSHMAWWDWKENAESCE